MVEINENYIKWNNKEFKMFTNILSLLSESMDNLLIKEGKIRQYSNEKRYILNIDINNLVSDKTLLIFGIKDKSKLLDTLQKQEADAKLIFSKNKYDIVADVTTISITPLRESLFKYLYLEKDEYDNLFNNYNTIVNDYEIDTKIVDRLSTFSNTLSSRLLRIEFEEDIINFKITASDNTSPTVISLLTMKNESKFKTNYSTILTKSLLVAPPPFKLSILSSGDDKRVALKISGELEYDEVKIPLTIMSFGDLIEEDGSELLAI